MNFSLQRIRWTGFGVTSEAIKPKVDLHVQIQNGLVSPRCPLLLQAGVDSAGLTCARASDYHILSYKSKQQNEIIDGIPFTFQ